MIFYWVIALLKKIGWFFKIPSVQLFMERDENAKCPVCGTTSGRLRCVVVTVPGPTARTAPARTAVRCQHRCNRCGARWMEEPIFKEATTDKILPSAPRDELEAHEDRVAKLQAEPPSI